MSASITNISGNTMLPSAITTLQEYNGGLANGRTIDQLFKNGDTVYSDIDSTRSTRSSLAEILFEKIADENSFGWSKVAELSDGKAVFFYKAIHSSNKQQAYFRIFEWSEDDGEFKVSSATNVGPVFDQNVNNNGFDVTPLEDGAFATVHTVSGSPTIYITIWRVNGLLATQQEQIPFKPNNTSDQIIYCSCCFDSKNRWLWIFTYNSTQELRYTATANVNENLQLGTPINQTGWASTVSTKSQYFACEYDPVNGQVILFFNALPDASSPLYNAKYAQAVWKNDGTAGITYSTANQWDNEAPDSIAYPVPKFCKATGQMVAAYQNRSYGQCKLLSMELQKDQFSSRKKQILAPTIRTKCIRASALLATHSITHALL